MEFGVRVVILSFREGLGMGLNYDPDPEFR